MKKTLTEFAYKDYAGPDFEGREQAFKLAEEGSWALARDAFEKALPLITEANQIRWCKYLLADSSWRAEDTPQQWQAKESWLEKHRAALTEQLKDYVANPGTYDDLWVALQVSLIALDDRVRPWDPDRVERLGDWWPILKHLASRQSSVGDVETLLCATQKALGKNLSGEVFAIKNKIISRAETQSASELQANYLDLLEKLGRDSQLSPADRAWCKLRRLLLSSRENLSSGEHQKRWKTLIPETQGTNWEPIAEAYLFLANQEQSPKNQAERMEERDIPALIATIDHHQERLLPTSQEALSLKEQLKSLRDHWTTPRFLLTANDQLNPGEDAVVSYGQCGQKSFRWKLLACSPIDYLRAFRDNNRNLGELLDKLPPVAEGSIELPPATSLRWSSGRLIAARALKPGLYLFVAETKKEEKSDWTLHGFVVSDLDVAMMRPEGRSPSFWLSHQSDHSPWVCKDVKLTYTQGLSSPSDARQTLNCDSQGRCEFTRFSPLSDKGETSLILMADGHPAIIKTYIFPHHRQLIAGELFVERPLVRPGDSFGFKLMLRERSGDTWEYTQAKLKATVTLNGTELLSANPLVLDKYGTWTQKLQIPADAKPGMLTLAVSDPTAERSRPLYEDWVTLVDHFIPPPITAKVNLACPAENLRPGKEIIIQVRASYLSGGGVSNAEVLLSPSFYRTYDPTAPRQQPVLEAWSAYLMQHPLKAATDEQGNAEFRISIPDGLESKGNLQFSYRVNAPGIAPISNSESWAITPSGLQFEMAASTPNWAIPGERNQTEVRLLDCKGQPVSLTLEAKLFKLNWTEHWKSPEGAEVRTDAPPAQSEQRGWRRISAGYERSFLRSETMSSDRTGRLRLDFSLPAEGVYCWEFSHDGRKVEGREYYPFQLLPGLPVISANEKTSNLPLDPDSCYLLTKEAAKPAEHLPVLVILPRRVRQGFLNISDEVTTSTLRLRPNTRVSITPVTVPAGRNQAFMLRVDAEGLNQDYPLPPWRTITKTPDPSSLRLQVTAHSQTVRPGSNTLLELSSRRADGQQGSPANIALSVMDDALNELVRQGAENEQSHLEMMQQHLQVIAAFNEHVERLELPKSSLDPREFDDPDEDTIVLSPFSISDNSLGGHPVRSTLAGTRTKMQMRDSGGDLTMMGPPPGSVSSAGGMALNTSDMDPVLDIRRHFSSSAFWEPNLHTDAQGHLSVKVPLPDNLTRWRAKAYAISDDGQRFALASTTFEAELPFQARLQQPRFLVDGDTVTLLGTLVNRSTSTQKATAGLLLSGPVRFPAESSEQTLSVPAAGETRGLWTLQAAGTGEAKLRLEARTPGEADGMETTLPVLEDGLQLELAATARLTRGAQACDFSLELPSPLDPARTQVTLRLTPSLAGALVDALPYLIDYPYGCVEQTMSRFLPAVVVKSVLQKQGFNASRLEQCVLARTSGRSQAAGFSSLDEVVAKSLERLEGAALPSGGFGWWPGSPYANHWMSAYVKWGLENARDAGVEVPEELNKQLTEFLVSELRQSKDLSSNTQAWMLAALCRGTLPEETTYELRKALAKNYSARESLTPWGRACLGLATARIGTEEQRALILRNMENGVLRASADGYGETVQWGKGSGYWFAEDSALEATAMSLLALLELRPDHPLVTPAATWLALNRRSDRWGNTRGTAFAVLALSRFLEHSRELETPVELEVQANGGLPHRVSLSRESLLAGTTQIPLLLSELHAGSNQFHLRRLSGEGPAYASVSASAWARGDAVKPAASLLSLSRSYTEQRTVEALVGSGRRETLPVGTASYVRLGSGLTAEVRLKVPHDTEYLILEIPKPAGCEPLNPLSGWDAELVPANVADADSATPRTFGSTRILYREEHDDRSVVFIDRISAGDWLIRLRLQTVFAGDFRILPVKAEAMYVPEIRANTESRRLRISAE